MKFDCDTMTAYDVMQIYGITRAGAHGRIRRKKLVPVKIGSGRGQMSRYRANDIMMAFADLRVIEKKIEKTIDMGHQPYEERRWDCEKYDGCLSEYAIKNKKMECNDKCFQKGDNDWQDFEQCQNLINIVFAELFEEKRKNLSPKEFEEFKKDFLE